MTDKVNKQDAPDVPAHKVLTAADIERIREDKHSCGHKLNPNPRCGCMCGRTYMKDDGSVLIDRLMFKHNPGPKCVCLYGVTKPDAPDVESATCKQSLQVPTEQPQEPLPPLDALFAVADGIIVCLKCRCSNRIKYGSTHYTDCPLFRPDPTDLLAESASLRTQLAEMTALSAARLDVIKSLGESEKGWREVADKAIARVQELETQLGKKEANRG
jgi:hypothetical protein